MYIVAQGHSFVTARGVISAGDEITEKDFSEKETFLKKVTKGHIVTGKSKAQLEKEAAEAKTAADKEKAKEAAIKLQQKKDDATRNIQTAEAALKNAQEAHAAAKETAGKLSGEIAARIKPQTDALEKKIGECEKAAKDAETAFEKAKPEQKEAAGNNAKQAADALEAAKAELAKVKLEAESTPELKKAFEESERTADVIIEAEANLSIAKEEAAKVK
jgi:hypothetical protein